VPNCSGCTPTPAPAPRHLPPDHRPHRRGQTCAGHAQTHPATDKARQKVEAAHLKAECALRDHPTLGHWLRQQANGRLFIDQAKIKQAARVDGKYLIATSDPHLSAEDTALGYKNLLEAERGFRDLKSSLLLRPVFHRLEHRIRAHVLLCYCNGDRPAWPATGCGWWG
jgi:hypothetical protein